MSLPKDTLDFSKLTKKDFPLVKDLTYEQEDMVIKLFKHKRVIVNAIAGSGKTVVLTQAMQALKSKGLIDKIYYVVFPVQENSLGYLPGGLQGKVQEYSIPFIQALMKSGVNISALDFDLLYEEFSGYEYKIVPHTFLRGRTIENAGVIIDEAQNGTVDELRKVLTRIDDSCYTSISGHTGQIDIEKENSGFSRYINHFKQGKEKGIFVDIDFAYLSHDFRGPFSKFADQI